MKLFCLGLFLVFAGIDFPGFTVRSEEWTLHLMTDEGNVSICHAVTLVDHDAKSTLLTITDGKYQQTFETRMTEAGFRNVWNQIPKIDDLKPYLRSDPNESLSASDHVIVRVLESTYGGSDYQLYWIPKDCKSDAVLSWLRAIENCSDRMK